MNQRLKRTRWQRRMDYIASINEGRFRVAVGVVVLGLVIAVIVLSYK